MSKKIPIGKGWAWLCNFGFVNWAEPTKDMLISDSEEQGGKPSPEAKAVPIRFMRETDYRKLMKLIKP